MAIGLIIFAIATNLHTAIFSFYGLKTNNLDGAVWAQTSSSSTNGYNPGDHSAPIWMVANNSIPCGNATYTINSTTTINKNRGIAVTVSFVAGLFLGSTTASGNYTSNSTSSYSFIQTVGAHNSIATICNPGGGQSCTPRNAIAACLEAQPQWP